MARLHLLRRARTHAQRHAPLRSRLVVGLCDPGDGHSRACMTPQGLWAGACAHDAALRGLVTVWWALAARGPCTGRPSLRGGGDPPWQLRAYGCTLFLQSLQMRSAVAEQSGWGHGDAVRAVRVERSGSTSYPDQRPYPGPHADRWRTTSRAWCSAWRPSTTHRRARRWSSRAASWRTSPAIRRRPN